MPTPKVLILTGDAAESLEVMYPYQRLRESPSGIFLSAFHGDTFNSCSTSRQKT
jgi:putative intracellular protease/amidase